MSEDDLVFVLNINTLTYGTDTLHSLFGHDPFGIISPWEISEAAIKNMLKYTYSLVVLDLSGTETGSVKLSLGQG